MTRIDEAVRAFKTFSPRRIVVIGDQWIMETIAWEGVPRRLIVRDSNPPTTRSQVARVTELVYEGNLGRTALIASRLQMPRILALLQREHVEMRLLPSPLEREPPASGIWLFVPAYSALCLSRDALYELMALEYYRWKGWI